MLCLYALIVGLNLAPDAALGRREIGALAAASLAALGPAAPAFASRSKLIPRKNAESTASFKAYQLSAPSEESEAFKAAEKLRAGRAETTTAAKKETDAEAIARLGLRSYDQALEAGFDLCKTWQGCVRNR